MAKEAKKKKKGKTPKELMRKHIIDKEDVISEEDFKNMEVGIGVDADNKEPLEIPENKDHPKDEDKDPGMVTPWDVIT
jgi:phosphoribosylamine-glycine ligase